MTAQSDAKDALAYLRTNIGVKPVHPVFTTAGTWTDPIICDPCANEMDASTAKMKALFKATDVAGAIE